MADREKVTTVRLDMDLYEQVALIARVEGRNYSDAMREALVAFVEARRSDPEFMGRLRSQIERDHELRLLEGVELLPLATPWSPRWLRLWAAGSSRSTRSWCRD